MAAPNGFPYLVFAASDHFLVLGDKVEASENGHGFLHLLVPLEEDGPAIVVHLDDEVELRSTLLIGSGQRHSIDNPGRGIALVLIDHTSVLGRCLQHRFLSGGQARFAFAVEDHERLCAAILPLVGGDISSVEYRSFWEGFLVLLGVPECGRHHRSPDSRVDGLLDYLKGSKVCHFSLADLAARCRLSSSRLSHLFRQHTGSSLKSYLLFRQLLRALGQVAEGAGVTDAALEAGFDSASHLAAVCRRLMGIVPGNMRDVSRFLKVTVLH